MKNLILTLIMLFTVATYTSAQGKKPVSIEGKPSYTETTDFIKTHFADKLFRGDFRFHTTYQRSGSKILQTYTFSIIDIDFTSSCGLNVEYKKASEWSFPNGRVDKNTETTTRSIDLSQTESLAIQSLGQEIAIYGLIFNVKNVAKRDEMDLPFARMEIKDEDDDKNFETLTETKVYKAFNHLRKLCGAPEPINF